MAQTREEKLNDYKGFVDKFKRKKTTDDCCAPPKVYETILSWVEREYGIDRTQVVRPFYPDKDYKDFDYQNKIVVDNPPFSILKEIKDFYVKNNIKFFLFAPHLTMFSSNDTGVSYIVTSSKIIYENGANVKTSFVTNLDKYKLRLVPELSKLIEEVQKKETFPKYEYPINVISSALLGKYVDAGVTIEFQEEELYFIRGLDNQKKFKKSIYGAGYLISDDKAAKLLDGYSNKKIKIPEDRIVWELSDKEKNIIRGLNGEGIC